MAQPLWADNIYLSEGFDKGVIPETFTMWDKDENPSKTGLKNITLVNGGWNVAKVDNSTSAARAAISSSYSVYDYAVEDWLITPAIKIEGAAVLRWDAQSVHYDLRDGYKVMISEKELNAADFVEVFSVEEEDYYYTSHAISLEKYIGKTIYIAFVHNSEQRFLLAIDNIVVGELETAAYQFENATPVTAQGGKDIDIAGSVVNLSNSRNYELVCRIDDAIYSTQEDVANPRLYEPGESRTFNFTVPTPAEGKLIYEVGAAEQNDTIWFAADTVFCSAFARNLLVEEWTGTWCTNCPRGVLTMNKQKRLLRGAMIPVVGHNADPMADDDYNKGLNYWFFGVPSIIYDRSKHRSQQGEGEQFMYGALNEPVYSEVVIPEVRYVKDSTIVVNSVARFSKEFSNADDRYRMAYVVSEKIVHDDSYTQINGQQNMPQYGEYYFLPSNIPGNLLYFHDVARGMPLAFSGEPNLLPTQLVAGEDYPVEHTFKIPNSVIDWSLMDVTVLVIDSQTRKVMSACRAEEIDFSESVHEIGKDVADYKITYVDGRVRVGLAGESAQVRVYAVDGSMIGHKQGSHEVSIDVHGYKGCAIVWVEGMTSSVYKKIMINQ